MALISIQSQRRRWFSSPGTPYKIGSHSTGDKDVEWNANHRILNREIDEKTKYLEDEPDDRSRRTVTTTATAAATSAVGLSPTDTGRCLFRQKQESQRHANKNRREKRPTSDKLCGTRSFHFNSKRGMSGSSFGFSPVAGRCCASKSPRSRNPFNRVSGSGFLPAWCNSNKIRFQSSAGIPFKTPRSAMSSSRRSSKER